jgi:hypothetical protein
MNFQIKNMIFGGVIGFISISGNAGLMNDVPYAMRDLHKFFSAYQDYKKLDSQVINNRRVDSYYSPSSIKKKTGERGNWEEYTYYTVVMKTANKNGYALEGMTFECGSNRTIIYNRLYYANDNSVLPQASQRLIVGSSPTFNFGPTSNIAKVQQMICGT